MSRKNEVYKDKLLNLIIGNKHDVVKVQKFLFKDFGRWFDIKCFYTVLEENLLDDLITYKKVIKEISNKLYLKVGETIENFRENDTVIDVNKIENYDELVQQVIKEVVSDEGKKIYEVVFQK